MFNNKDFNNSLANKFNKKKTIQNDLSRFQNIHKKINNFVPIVKNIPIPTNNTFTINEPIYDFDQNCSLLNIKFENTNGSDINKIPKILFKDTIVPPHSDNDNFTLNKLYQNISIQLHMDIFTSDIINDADVNRLKKKKVSKIIHLYQEKYTDNKYATGFGDFIRSCFFILQFSNKYDFQYEIIINHPIAQFLKKFSSNYHANSYSSLILNNKVPFFYESNWYSSVFDNQNYIEKFLLNKNKFNDYINYLCSLPVINNSIISYNVFFPYDTISQDQCNIISSLFEPTNEIYDCIEQIFYNLSLTKNKFLVIHIRSGDSFLKNDSKIFNSLHIEIIKNEIFEIIFKNIGVDILLIADNNEIKILLSHEFPNFKFLINNITHLGEGSNLKRDNVKNTLIDFYLMSYASFIYSFTAYPHGSGFSYWCSKIYNIPYKCKYIDI